MFWKIYSIVEMQSRQWDSTVFNEAGNRGNQIVSKQPFLFYSEFVQVIWSRPITWTELGGVVSSV